MNIYKGLMFLHGHFIRPEDLEEPRLEYGAHTAAADFAPPLGNRAASAAWLAGRSHLSPSQPASDNPTQQVAALRQELSRQPQPRGLLDHLRYLGGRPMHAGHNFDIEEPFDADEAPAPVPAAAAGKTVARDCHGNERRTTAGPAQPLACSG